MSSESNAVEQPAQQPVAAEQVPLLMAVPTDHTRLIATPGVNAIGVAGAHYAVHGDGTVDVHCDHVAAFVRAGLASHPA